VTSHQSGADLRLALSVVVLALSLSASQAQDKADKTASLRVPHTTKPVLIDCSNNSASWANVPRIALSKESVTVTGTDTQPVEIVFLISDPTRAATNFHHSIESKLDSFHAPYAFQWDEDRLYGYVEIKEQDLDSRHPEVSEKAFRSSPDKAAFDDMFFSSAIVEVGAPSWQRWITEMHVHVRSPNAKPMTSMSFGRTNDEENFRPLAGEAIACPADGGWIAKFAVTWLPFGDWHPKSGVTANIRLLAPLAHAHQGYVLASVVPFVLTN
jgi:hypothetical protein